MLKQLREMKLSIPMLAVVLPSSKAFLGAEDLSSEGLKFVDFP